jgi:hypothetical protein
MNKGIFMKQITVPGPVISKKGYSIAHNSAVPKELLCAKEVYGKCLISL